jgi:peptidoglycan/LPS O-acetylase OafA/YrhL
MLLRPAILVPNNRQSPAHVFKSLESQSAARTHYIAELDGIRALAFAFVFLVHTMPAYFPGGFIGVDIFFVLSGYLITKILYAEFESTGRIDLRNFYVRRTLRLMPAFLVMLFAYVLIVLIRGLHNHPDHFLRDNILAALTSALYIMNWTQAFHLGPHGLLIHTWSLAIEEQFYLIWPLALICLVWKIEKKQKWKVVVLLIAISVTWQLFCVSFGASVDRLYFGFDMSLITLLTGCLLALAPLAKIQRLAACLSFFPISLLVVMLLSLSWTSPLLYPWGLIVVAVCAAWTVLAAVKGQTQGWLRRFLRLAPLSYCGRISYGLYLWHYPIALVALGRFGNQPSAQLKITTVTATGALLAASASYFMLERPLLKLRRQFS